MTNVEFQGAYGDRDGGLWATSKKCMKTNGF